MTINTDYTQFLHSYEAIRVPANSVPQDKKGNIIKENEDDTVLLLTDEAKKQMDKDRNAYSTKISAQLEMEQAKKNSEAEKKEIEDMTKILAVFRSMCNGNNVPPSDEKKLMEYDDKLYSVAKQAQIKAQLEKDRIKNEKSLWEDEDETEATDEMDPLEIGQQFAAFKEAQTSSVVEVPASSVTTSSGTNFDMSI